MIAEVASPPAPGYRRSPAPEPHRGRRRAILAAHPEIRALFGHDPWPKYRMAAVVLAQLLIAAWFGRRAAGAGGLPLMLAAAWLVGAVMNHYGGVIIHEAAHDLCARTSLGNRAVAMMANLPIVLPTANSFRRHHMGHHRHLGEVGRDNDLPADREAAWVGRSGARKLVWLLLYPFFGVFARGFWVRPDRWEVAGVVLQLVFDLLVWRLCGPAAIGYLLLSTFFAYGLHPIAGHFIHEHYLWSGEQETYSYYGVLNRVTLNMGFHVEHHDFFQIPGARLPAYHRLTREFYAPLSSHRSWTGVLWTFLRTPELSHYSRMTRDGRA